MSELTECASDRESTKIGPASQCVLVTGGTGFIGRHLCRRLLAEHRYVHVLSRTLPTEEVEGARLWQADMADLERVSTLLKMIKPDVVFHLAGASIGSRDMGLVEPIFRSNLMGTINLLIAASGVRCRRIIIAGTQEEPEAGDTHAVPCSPYAAAKWAASAYARMFHALYGLPVVLLRIFMVYGPGHESLRKLTPHTILSLLKGEAPRLSSGGHEIDWVYVDDVVEAFLAAASKPAIEGQTFDIGSGKTRSIRSLVEYLVSMINPALEPRYGAIHDRALERTRIASLAPAEELLGWRPATSLESGLQQTVAWYREQVRAGLL